MDDPRLGETAAAGDGIRAPFVDHWAESAPTPEG